ncbi:hypothetical protein AQUCO_01400238v1 [Aquilegia coerulea]|uniref:demethylphylloquinone reductase n=1 Tax=Aquilegia coerulea TaxID=218851 RepID=A0A2G5DVH3_AQUCA|nr:hypothetical protein AQUCO_01400238v1 [Aquilegia coerulea]
MVLISFSASATVTPFGRKENNFHLKQIPKFLASNLPIFGSRFSDSNRMGRRRFCSLASNSMEGNRGVVATSDGETPLPLYTWPDKQKPRICILGGGFGGLYTALRLESLVWSDDKKPQVVLVDQSDRFVFKPMLYELLSGEVDTWEIAPRFVDLLANTSVQFVQDRVKFLQPSDHLEKNGSTRLSCGGTVQLESGQCIEYDWLVLALGAEPKLDLVPGAAEFALPFSTLEDAWKVDKRLKSLEREKFGKPSSPISVVVVGCGYAGVELAATVAERLQGKGKVQAINVGTTICPGAPPGNREAAMKVLSSRNVQLYLGYFVSCIRKADKFENSDQLISNLKGKDTVVEQPHGGYILELQPAERGVQSQILEADLILWTVGSKPLLPEAEPYVFPVNGRGQAETDETLRVKGHPRVFAIGDSAALRDSSGRILPATAQVAFQQADFAGWNIWAAINDRPLLPFRFQNLGEMMTLGRNDAAITPSFIEGLTLDGPIGHAGIVCCLCISLLCCSDFLTCLSASYCSKEDCVLDQITHR